jgi:hypothetical protein
MLKSAGADSAGLDILREVHDPATVKPLRKYLIALGLVGLWAVFSYAYLGVEHARSYSLSPLGWICAVFLLPGGFLLHALKGTLSNADLALAVPVSLGVYAVVVILAIKSAGLLRQAVRRAEK